MKHSLSRPIKAGILSTVMVVSTLMLLTVAALFSLWNIDSFIFARTQYEKAQRNDIESAYVIYSTHPECFTEETTPLTIFPDRPRSKVLIEREPWGLYERVSVIIEATKTISTRIMGARIPSKEGCGFFHPENLRSVTLSGNTNILTEAHLPKNGFVYGQMNTEFFCGEKVPSDRMKPAGNVFPTPLAEITETLDSMFSLQPAAPIPQEHLSAAFYGNRPFVFQASEQMSHCSLSGKIVVMAEKLAIDSTCQIEDIVVICSNLVIKKGFEGSLQAFVRDTVCIEPEVHLYYPSGIYAEKLVEMSDHSIIEGYIAVNQKNRQEITEPGYLSSCKSLVRGLVYVNGNAHLQGIVSGSVFVKEAVHYTPNGYYRGILHDFTLLDNKDIAYPLLLDNGKRREIKWVKQ